MKQLVKAFLFSLLIFILLSFYLFFRRGDYNLYIANKAIAVSALFLIGLSLIFGGFCYLCNFSNIKLIYRKWLGIMGFIFSAVHIFISEVLLRDKFKPLEEIFQNEVALSFGKFAFLLFFIMFLFSNKFIENKLGEFLWRKIFRYCGNIGFLFIGVHLFILKYKEWIKWFETFNPALPPLSLFGIIFIVFVFILQIVVFISKKNGNQRLV